MNEGPLWNLEIKAPANPRWSWACGGRGIIAGVAVAASRKGRAAGEVAGAALEMLTLIVKLGNAALRQRCR